VFASVFRNAVELDFSAQPLPLLELLARGNIPIRFLDDITHFRGLNRVHCDLYALTKFSHQGVSGVLSFGAILAEVGEVCLAIVGPQTENS
jgi:hypothetical protein